MMSRPPEAPRFLIAVPPPEIAYFHAILEGYDDLAVMRTISADEGIIEVYVSPGRDEDFTELLDALRDEGIPIREIEKGGGGLHS